MKYIGIQCDICGYIGPGSKVKWLDFTDNIIEIQNIAKSQDWLLKGAFDKCPDCRQKNLNTKDLAEIKLSDRSRFLKTFAGKEEARRKI